MSTMRLAGEGNPGAPSGPDEFANSIRCYRNPDRRHPNRRVAFGTGIHVCLGATLARAETAIAPERRFTRFPNFTLAVPQSDLRYSARLGTRSLLALPVRW